jgi:hypothetical protein
MVMVEKESAVPEYARESVEETARCRMLTLSDLSSLAWNSFSILVVDHRPGTQAEAWAWPISHKKHQIGGTIAPMNQTSGIVPPNKCSHLHQQIAELPHGTWTFIMTTIGVDVRAFEPERMHTATVSDAHSLSSETARSSITPHCYPPLCRSLHFGPFKPLRSFLRGATHDPPQTTLCGHTMFLLIDRLNSSTR